MDDVWLGKLFDQMDELNLWEDTTVILTTDHGHLLGEHGYWAKNYMFDYQKLVYILLVMYHPNAPNYHLLYNVQKDPDQESPIRDEAIEQVYISKLTELMNRYHAPECQYKRVGLTSSK